MENKASDEPLVSIVQSFIEKLMADDHSAAEISFTLVEQATVLGLAVSPSSKLAMIVVMDGMQSGCASKLESEEVEHGDPDEEETAPIGATLH
jgi:hypothetical protein